MGCCATKEKVVIIPKFSQIREKSSKKKERKSEKSPLLQEDGEMDEEQKDELQIREKLVIKTIKVKNNDKRNKIIEEILKTEQTYVNSLVVFAERILKPLIEEWANKSQKEQLLEMRNKIEAVFVVNFTLMDLLEEKALNNSLNECLGNVFQKLVPFLKLYSVKNFFLF